MLTILLDNSSRGTIAGLSPNVLTLNASSLFVFKAIQSAFVEPPSAINIMLRFILPKYITTSDDIQQLSKTQSFSIKKIF